MYHLLIWKVMPPNGLPRPRRASSAISPAHARFAAAPSAHRMRLAETHRTVHEQSREALARARQAVGRPLTQPTATAAQQTSRWSPSTRPRLRRRLHEVTTHPRGTSERATAADPLMTTPQAAASSYFRYT